MDRKKFLKASGAGVGLALVPEAFKTVSKGPTAKSKVVRNDQGNVLNVLGDLQTHKLVGSETGNQIVEWVDDVEPGVGIPPHVHTREDEIFRVLAGEVEFMIDGKTTVLKKGDIAFAPRNLPHAWMVVGTEKAQMITSAFPAGIEGMFSKLADLPSDGPPDLERVAEICGEYGISFLKA